MKSLRSGIPPKVVMVVQRTIISIYRSWKAEIQSSQAEYGSISGEQTIKELKFSGDFDRIRLVPTGLALDELKHSIFRT